MIIWHPRLVATMIDLLDALIAEGDHRHRRDVAPWHRRPLQRTLLEVLDRDRDGWISVEVPADRRHPRASRRGASTNPLSALFG